MKQKKLLYCALIVVWITLFFFSTELVLLVNGYYLNKLQIDVSSQSQDVLFHLETFSSPEGLLKKVYFSGWAFNKNYQPNSERHVSLILKEANFAYEIQTNSSERGDVDVYFSDLDLGEVDLGFGGKFSILAIDDGTYELFIKVWEEGKEPTLKSTNQFFLKKKNAFMQISSEDLTVNN